MEVGSQLSRQRVKYIVSSYGLDRTEVDSCSRYLNELLESYPMPAVELALVEVLVENWSKPFPSRGILFLERVTELLRTWKETSSVAVRVTPNQFQQITGLDPSPIFGPTAQSVQLSCESSPTEHSACG